MPPDREVVTPHLAALIIGHVADCRGQARQEQRGREEKEEPCLGAEEAAGAAVAQVWGGVAMRPPPASSLWCGNSCRGGTGVTLEMMDDNQKTIKS